MATTRELTSVRLDGTILRTLKEEAKADNRSLSNYLEKLLLSLGYRPYNEETAQACEEARKGIHAGVVDTTNIETIHKSLFMDED